MNAVRSSASTLAGAIWPGETNRAIRAAALIALGVVVMMAAAKVKVPFYPVPVTLQTLALPLIAAAYGSRLGTATIVAYLAAGFVGLQVFSNTPPSAAGPLYFLGPTGGYLAAYPLAAWLIGRLAETGSDRSLLRLFGAMVLGDLVIFLAGFAWLALAAQLANGAVGLGFEGAWNGGVKPFLLPDLVKLALAAALIRAGWAVVGRLRG
jgi:biotin transport system substrate-specific component